MSVPAQHEEGCRDGNPQGRLVWEVGLQLEDKRKVPGAV